MLKKGNLSHRKSRSPSRSSAGGLEEPDRPPSSESAPALARILDTLLRHTQINFSKYKMSTIKRRVERQMMLHQIETLESYAEYLHKNADEVHALYEDILVHVTDFFRDPDAFHALRENVFPELTRERPGQSPIRIWVPGCATGEEAYSLAISMLEYLSDHGLRNPIQIFATDISDPAIRKARKGIFVERQMSGISPERLERFFEKVKDGYKVGRQVRDACVFSQHDVTSNPPIPRVDLISCRNVLIYFSADLQDRVFPVFHYALNPDAFLWLGKAENPGRFLHLFSPVDKENRIYRKVNGRKARQPALSAINFRVVPPPPAPLAANPPPSMVDFIRGADQVLLYRYSPSSVVIDNNLNILQFRGRVVPYLEPSPGLATYNLLKMAHPDIEAAVRLCLQAARDKNTQCRKEDTVFSWEGRKRKVNVDVSPLNPTAPPRERLYLVIFEETAALRPGGTKSRAPSLGPLTSRNKQSQIDTLAQHNAQLQQELETTRENQQSLIEEYETAKEELTSANEELRSTNEELQSANEELQSANEELGTAKQELQAANLELSSVNEALQKKNLELKEALKALEQSEQRSRLIIESVKDYAIFMLDPEGRVASWNEGARRIKGYTASEIIGRSFSTFYPRAEIESRKPEFELKEAVRIGRFEDEGWRLRKDGSRFWANVVISPIVSKEGEVLGFSKVTRDLSERRRAEERLRESLDNLESRVLERTAELAKANGELATAVRARDEFLSIASHELKTPLTSMSIQTQLRWRAIMNGKMEAFTPEKLRKMVESDAKQLNRLTRLIDDMLDTTRIAAGKLSLDLHPVDLAELVREVLERLAEQFRAARSPIGLDAPGSVIGRWDRYRIEQVVVNLLTNAMKYGAGKPIQVRVELEGRHARLVVRDEGVGIASADQERIFQLFERVTNIEMASGLGLGLYIVRKIVEGHQGSVRVESALNQGATFIVELPMEPAVGETPP